MHCFWFWDWTGWTAVAAIATCIVAVGVIVAFKQIQQARRSTNAKITVDLFQQFRDETTVEKLRSIYALNSEDIKNLQDGKNNEIKRTIDHVLDWLDTLGALVIKKIVDQKLAVEVFAGLPALRCWYKLGKDYIKKERKKRGYFGENYEAFARLSLDYFKKHHMQAKLYGEDKENEVIDLIEKLQEKEFIPRSLEEIKKDRKTDKQK